jgi:hypothetical protein
MIAPFVVLLLLLAVGIFLLTGAVMEMYQQLRQIRTYLDLTDRPDELDLTLVLGARPSSVGLPHALDSSASALVVFLSNKCDTCRLLAQHIATRAVPSSLWVVVAPVLGGTADEYIAHYQLTSPTTIADNDMHITRAIGLEITPASLLVQDGIIMRARTIPSARQLTLQLGELHRRPPAYRTSTDVVVHPEAPTPAHVGATN